jgi:ubiquinone biosynthesis protein
VTIKVQRPGVAEIIETDLGVMRDVAHFLNARSPALRRYNLPALVEEFAAIIHDELLYRVEAYNAHRLRENLAGLTWVQVPEVLWELTTQHVLTTERVYGLRIDRTKELRERGVDLPDVARRFAQCMLQQVFVDGFFHGDPHQGNVWVRDDGVIVFLDFGMVGRLDRRFRRALTDLLLALKRQDSEAALDEIAEMGMMGEHQDVTALRHDLRRLFLRYYFLPRREFPLGELFVRVVQLISRHRVPVPWEFSRLGKALVLTEGICHELDRQFDFDHAAAPVIEALRRERMNPRHLIEEVADLGRDMARNLAVLPERLNQVLSELRRGTLRLRVSDDEVDHILRHRNTLVNRVSLALILSALEIGTSIFVVSSVVSTAAKLWIGVPVAVIIAIAIFILLGGITHPRE